MSIEESSDLATHFGDAAARVRYEDLPGTAVEAAKKSVLDTVGVILAASGMEPAVAGLVELVRETGGREEASILGHPGRYPSDGAAFANGAMAHCLDFDDQTPWGQHCASSVVPAVLSLVERTGPVSGKEVVVAVAVGQDLFARLRCHIGWRKDWNLSSAMAVYAATAAAGRILRLPPHQLTHALGIASMQSSGVMEMIAGTGSDLRGMYAGFSARGAVTAALLATKGITGIARLFEGENGVFATYFGGDYDRDAMLDGLGRQFHGDTTLYKMWPSVGTSHSHIAAMIAVMTEHDLAVEDISEIRLSVGDYHQLMCRPLEARQAPSTLADAKFSLPYLVAVAAVHRAVGVRDFTSVALSDERVRRTARKIVLVPDADLDWRMELPSGRVAVVTSDGRILEQIGDRVPGGLELPLTWQQLGAKFADCASQAANPPSAESVRDVERDIRQLEDVEDVTGIIRRMSASTSDAFSPA